MTATAPPDTKPRSSSDAAGAETPGRILLPAAPSLVAGLSAATWISADGEVLNLAPGEAATRARSDAPLLCHAQATARRLGVQSFPAYDLLELFAFVRPARFCTPTPGGLAQALGLPPPANGEAAASLLRDVAGRLLGELAARDQRRDREAPAIARVMDQGGWSWGPFVISALGEDADAPQRGGFNVWDRLPAWSDQAPPPPPGQEPVSAAEARTRLDELRGSDAEDRPGQADYASAVSQAFAPRAQEGEPQLVLAEAGTGIGKTLAYIAPASLWAEKNKGTVWISTFTRNLQHQIDGELDKLCPTAKEKARRVVIRKGRENYLCLLNLEEAARGLPTRPGDAIALGLMVRWAARSRDGDMVGGDFPGWLADLAGRGRTLGLTDRRGECIYSACAHYGRCFIERGVRKARHADIVVANHALVMIQAALGAGEEGQLPGRYIFDEGHHIFDAADGAFAAHLSGQETHALRRWLLGAEGRARGNSRNRGLRRRVEDLILDDQELQNLLEQALRAAHALPGDGWHQRLAGGEAEAEPQTLTTQTPTTQTQGACENFLRHLRAQVYARVQNSHSPYSLECDARPPSPEMLAAAATLAEALAQLYDPLDRFRRRLAARLDGEAEALDSDTRRRIEATCRAIERRANLQIGAWRRMLAALEAETPPEFVDWLAVERSDGRDMDVGMYRHWIDPTRPFAEALLAQAQGVAITSATLTDGSGDPEADWATAERRSGAAHLPNPAIRAKLLSPFDYVQETRVFVVNDVRKDEMDQVAAAYRALFLAAGGGGLGLFTAISRLRAVHQRIGASLEQAGLPLYAQHVDGLDTATLVDIFRADRDACLLGTDAMRDGVDVPGAALRLIVFDRVPWPRPDIRHRARRAAFGGRHYDDQIARLRLKQAYGRLIRSADDKGVFVLLDPMMPSRLCGAFPEGVEVQRVGLAEAVREAGAFLAAP